MKKKFLITIVFFLCLYIAGLSSKAVARNIYVATWGDDVLGDGSQSDPFRTIQKGIDEAIDWDNVLVYSQFLGGPPYKGACFKGKRIEVRSYGLCGGIDPENCIVSNRYFGQFIFKDGETAESKLRGFTITNKCGSQYGAIKCVGSSPTIEYNIIKGNQGVVGGGIACINSSSPTILYNIITENSANWGGRWNPLRRELFSSNSR